VNHLVTPKHWVKQNIGEDGNFADGPGRVTQMVTDRKEDTGKTSGKTRVERDAPQPNKINGSTPYDFNGRNLTPYGGLLPVITMLEKLGFESLVKETLTSKRIPRAMDLYRFVLGIVLACTSAFHD